MNSLRDLGMMELTHRLPDDQLYSDIVDVRHGGKVERAHRLPHIGTYSVAEHSWGVAMLLLQIWPKDFPRLAAVALAHDVPEGWTGDIPYNVAHYLDGRLDEYTRRVAMDLHLPTDLDLGDEDRAKLRFCDTLEFYLWCRDQVALGNQFVQAEMTNALYELQANPPDPGREVIDFLTGFQTQEKRDIFL